MKQYLKMADVIDGFVLTSGVRCVTIGGSEQQSSALILAVDSKTADYTAHAINSHDELVQMNQELLSALEDAATSLETIQLRSFGEDSFLDSKPEMRSYAGSRASVVRAAIAKAKGGAA